MLINKKFEIKSGFLFIQILMLSTLLASCLATTSTNPLLNFTEPPKTRMDEIPMYGGMDRSSSPEIKIADEKFISDVSKHYGSRETASKLWVDQGFKFYQQDNLGMAMRRFNQAWLLNPKNPEVFWGFGSILHDQGKNCEAMNLMDKAVVLDPPIFTGIYSDAARIVTLCAISDKRLSIESKNKLIVRSEALYEKAEKIERSKNYVYASWATAYYWRGDYEAAWSMVAKLRKAGGDHTKRFLNLLKAKMPEPS